MISKIVRNHMFSLYIRSGQVLDLAIHTMYSSLLNGSSSLMGKKLLVEDRLAGKAMQIPCLSCCCPHPAFNGRWWVKPPLAAYGLVTVEAQGSLRSCGFLVPIGFQGKLGLMMAWKAGEFR